jgi:hypothetical protein
MNTSTTSPKAPSVLKEEVLQVLRSLSKCGVRFEQDRHSKWVLICEVSVDTFLNSSLDATAPIEEVAEEQRETTFSTAAPQNMQLRLQVPPGPGRQASSPLRNDFRMDSIIPSAQASSPHGEEDVTEGLRDLDMNEPESPGFEEETASEGSPPRTPSPHTSASAATLGPKPLPATVTFQIEVCKVPRLNLHGLHFKRLAGGVWNYKKVSNKLMPMFEL